MTPIQLNIKEVKELLKFKYMQMINSPGLKVRPLYIEGHAGIGKSQIVRQAAKELTEELAEMLAGEVIECKMVSVQFAERPDFMGYPRDVEQDGEVVMKYSRPILLPNKGYGFYFMDEANRVDKDIRSGMLTLLEDREINGHTVGKFWLPVLAGNPTGDDNYETNEMDAALRDRIAKVVMIGDAQLTIDHYKKKYGDHPLVGFISNNPDFLSYSGDGCSPRSFEYAMIATLDHKQMPEELLYVALAAELGVQGASTIMAFMKDSLAPKYDQVLSGAEEAFQWLSSNPGRNDVINGINKAFVTDLKNRQASKKKFYDEEIKSIRRYLESVSDEHKLALVTDTNRENLFMGFIETFIQGTPMTEFFIQVYATYNQKP